MPSGDTPWHRALQARFRPRATLDRDTAYREHWASLGVPRAVVEGVFDLLEVEYDLPGGYFRPDDPLATFLEPVPASGLFGRWTHEVRAGDRQLALGDHLESCCKAARLPLPRGLVTLGEYVRACAGLVAG